MMKKKYHFLWLTLLLGILTSQEDDAIIITEFFTKSGPGTYLPDFIEIYNSTDSSIDLSGWSINDLVIEAQELVLDVNGEDVEAYLNSESIISAKGYLIIAGIGDPFYDAGGNMFYAGYNLPNSIYINLSLSHSSPDTISILNDADIIDFVTFSLDPDDGIPGWPDGIINRGHSLQLDNPNNDNLLPESWSLSPATSLNSYLYDEDGSASDLKNFATPGEENCFTLISPANGETNYINGDINNNPLNNYNDPIGFSWAGTFSDDGLDLEYQLFIEKEGVELLTLNMGAALSVSILPEDLQIFSLQSADFSWKVELIKGSDLVQSNQFIFAIDASAYGNYGCLDADACNYDADADIDNGNCELESCVGCMDDGSQTWSNYPEGCIPVTDCLPAMNYSADYLFNCTNDCCQYVILSLPNSTLGFKDSLIFLPVSLANNGGVTIESLQYDLIFDPAILQYEGSTLENTILDLWNYTLETESENNQVSNDINTSGNLYPDGGIITLHQFRVVGDFGQFSELVLANMALNSFSVPGVNGTFLVQGEFDIAGNILYYQQGGVSSGISLPGVELSLLENTSGELLDTTNLLGDYHFSGIMNGFYTLTPAKNTDLGGLSGVDASRIARFSVGDPTVNFNPLQILAADVTLNDFISGMDASRVARFTVGLIDSLNGAGLNWLFNPGFYDYTDPPLSVNEFNQDFTGIRLGDVSGNWTPDNVASQRRKSDFKEFTYLNINDHEKVTIHLLLVENQIIEGIDLIIRFDSNFMEYIGFELSNYLAEDIYHSLVNLEKPGLLKISVWAASPPLNCSGILGKLKFNLISTGESGKVWLDKAEVNEQPDQIEFEFTTPSGIIITSSAITIKSGISPEEFKLMQNYPNPFNPLTSIRWTQPEAGFLTLGIYNLRGEMVELLRDKFMQAGSHQLNWNASKYPAGIYFSKLDIAGKSFQKKMILLK